MTIATLVARLHELACFLEYLRQGTEAKCVNVLEDFLKPHSEAKAPQFFKKAKPTSEVASSWTGTRVSKAIAILDAYIAMQKLPAPKTAKEIGLLVDFLKPYEAADLDQFVKAASQAAMAVPAPRPRRVATAAVNLALVEDYVHLLRPNVGKSTFLEGFDRLKNDVGARKQEMAEIAKRLMPAPPSGLDRKKALKAIEDLHRSASGFDLKLKASGGRSAA